MVEVYDTASPGPCTKTLDRFRCVRMVIHPPVIRATSCASYPSSECIPSFIRVIVIRFYISVETGVFAAKLSLLEHIEMLVLFYGDLELLYRPSLLCSILFRCRNKTVRL